MNFADMIELEKTRSGTRLYDRNEDNDLKIKKLIAQTTTELVNMPEKVDMNQTELVKRIVKAYLLACYEAGSVPSKLGMCRAMGISRQGAEQFLQRHPDHATSQFLEVVFDGLADILSNAALTNSVNMVLSIFLLKSIFGFKESVVLETPATNPLGPEITPEEIASRYTNLPGE